MTRPQSALFEGLKTDRLFLRPRTEAEAGVYRRLWTERDPRVPVHRRIDSAGRPTLADIASEIRHSCGAAHPGLLTIQLKATGEVIGYCGLIRHDNAPQEPELAYELLHRWHGFGYATEAAGAVLSFATEVGYPRVWASVRAWNTPSRRVLEKLGFHETGEVKIDAVHGDSLLTVRSL